MDTLIICVIYNILIVSDCKKIFHLHCVKAALNGPCQEIPSVGKENASPQSKKPRRIEQEENWNLTRTSEFIDKSDEVIKDAYELRRLDEFIRRKVITLYFCSIAWMIVIKDHITL